MKILVPVDGSAHSKEALKVAMDFVKTKGAEVLVISVVALIGGLVVDHEISPSRREKITAGLEKIAEDAVKDACAVLSADNITSSCTKTIVTSISVPDAIIDFVEKEQIDLIVMGSRWLSPSARFKMGSVASQVVRDCPCSVYLVKTPAA